MRVLRTRVMPGMCAKVPICPADLFFPLRGECRAIEDFDATAAGAKRTECASQRGLLLFVSSIILRRSHSSLVLVAVAILDGIYWRQRTGAGRRRFLAWTGGEKKCFPSEINPHIFRLKAGRDGETKAPSIENKSSKTPWS